MILSVLGACLPATLPVFAQGVDFEAYEKAAREGSLLFRGRRPVGYKFQHNGTPYWDTPLFYGGTLRYNRKTYRVAAFNLDAVRHQLIVREPESGDEVQLNRDEVEAFTFGERRFVNGELFASPRLPAGFYEIFFEGKARILKRIDKELRHVGNERLLDTGEKGLQVLHGIYDVYLPSVSFYYVDENGGVWPIRRRNDLLKHYKAQKSRIRKMIRQEEGEYGIGLEEYIWMVMNFVEYGE